jgi:hypothetical protein
MSTLRSRGHYSCAIAASQSRSEAQLASTGRVTRRIVDSTTSPTHSCKLRRTHRDLLRGIAGSDRGFCFSPLPRCIHNVARRAGLIITAKGRMAIQWSLPAQRGGLQTMSFCVRKESKYQQNPCGEERRGLRLHSPGQMAVSDYVDSQYPFQNLTCRPTRNSPH